MVAKVLIDPQFDFLMPTVTPLCRIGCDQDGGYVVPQICVDMADSLLALGIGYDCSFEQDWHSRNPAVIIHAYDDDVQTDFGDFFQHNCVLHRQRVNKTFIDPDFLEFDDAMGRLSGQTVFVKIDIEGGEYNLVDDLCRHRDRILGMAIEFHGVGTSSHHCFLDAIPGLLREFDIVHVHGNNSGPVTACGLPEYLEISWLRKNFCGSDVRKQDLFVPELDRPNSIYSEDYALYFAQGRSAVSG